MPNGGMAEYLTAAETAEKIRRSVPTLERWRRLRVGPPFIRMLGQVLYDPKDVDSWLQSQKQNCGGGS